MNVVCYERGLLWTWSVMNTVCYEHGLLWTRSVMNTVCYEHGLFWVVCYEQVFFEQTPTKIQPMGHIQPTNQFNPACQYLAHFLKYNVFDCGQQCTSIRCCLSLVDLSAAAALSCKQRYKSVNKIVWFYCFIVLQCNLTTYYCIAYVNRTVSGTPVANQLQIQPLGQKVWPTLPCGNSIVQTVTMCEGTAYCTVSYHSTVLT